MSLLASLGLDEVSADPNDIPVGKYDGIVLKSQFVLQENKDTLSHALTYKVTEGEFAGAQKQQWYTLYENPRDANGVFPTDIKDLKAAKPALSENAKRYYKKLFVDLLGIPEEEVKNQEPEVLEGRPITFGVKLKDGYKNVSFVEARQSSPSVPAGPVSLDPFTQATAPQAAAPVANPGAVDPFAPVATPGINQF